MGVVNVSGLMKCFFYNVFSLLSFEKDTDIFSLVSSSSLSIYLASNLLGHTKRSCISFECKADLVFLQSDNNFSEQLQDGCAFVK